MPQIFLRNDTEHGFICSSAMDLSDATAGMMVYFPLAVSVVSGASLLIATQRDLLFREMKTEGISFQKYFQQPGDSVVRGIRFTCGFQGELFWNFR